MGSYHQNKAKKRKCHYLVSNAIQSISFCQHVKSKVLVDHRIVKFFCFRRNLGGKLGQQLIENFGVQFIGQVTDIPKSTLITTFGVKSG